MVNLSVRIGSLKLKNPVIAASGTFGEEYGELLDVKRFGAVIAKTVTLKPRSGNPPPRLVETPSGMLNSIGLENKGIDDFIKNKLPKLKKFKVPLIVSIAGEYEEEFRELAARLSRLKDIDALEVNLSCPNIRHGRRDRLIAQDEGATYEMIEAVRKNTRLTIIAKLSPNVSDITRIAVSAKKAGADALTIANTFLGMSVDVETKTPRLGNITGGLSGPAIKPITLRMVWEAHSKIKLPIIASGGIMDHKDALEFIICGAGAVQLGTANFVDPRAALNIVNGIKGYLSAHKITDINKLVGSLKS